MKVAIVFDPDPDLGPDPLDRHKTPRSAGAFIDAAVTDTIVIYREWGEQFDGGYRDHILASGIWENIPTDQWEAVLGHLAPAL